MTRGLDTAEEDEIEVPVVAGLEDKRAQHCNQYRQQYGGDGDGRVVVLVQDVTKLDSVQENFYSGLGKRERQEMILLDSRDRHDVRQLVRRDH